MLNRHIPSCLVRLGCRLFRRGDGWSVLGRENADLNVTWLTTIYAVM